MVCATISFFVQKISRFTFIAIISVGIAYGTGYMWYKWCNSSWYEKAAQYEKQTIGCIGILQNYRYDQEKNEHIYAIQSRAIRHNQTLLALQRNIYLKTKEKLFGCVGDLISVSGIYVGSLFSESFMYYLARHGIHIFAKSTSYTKSYCIIPKYSWWYYYKNIAKESICSTVHNGSTRLQNLFLLLFVGENVSEYKAEFQQWGAQHIAARSGVHFNIIAYIIGMIISLLPISIFMQCILLIISSLLYALSSAYSIAFLRALIVFIFTCIAHLLQRTPDMITILSITTLAILVWNPWYLMSLDFQLSFGITLILILAFS